jgi:hypothetical protein
MCASLLAPLGSAFADQMGSSRTGGAVLVPLANRPHFPGLDVS